ncbi:hypothetical protein ACFLT7_05915 [candidate division KSB1 bacterium]
MKKKKPKPVVPGLQGHDPKKVIEAFLKVDPEKVNKKLKKLLKPGDK